MRASSLTAISLASVLLIITTAANASPCSDLTADGQDNNITKIYIENGDTQEPLVKRLGKALLASTAGKVRIIYRNRPTCNIRNDLFNGTPMITTSDGATPRPVRYIPESAAFDPATMPAPTCTVPDAAPGPTISLGIGATYLSSCPALAQPADIGVFDGPVQAYGFITHKDSKQVAITAEEGYLAYGFNEGLGEASPWVVQNLRFKRGNTASTTLTMASAIRLLPTDLKTSDPAGIGTSDLLITGVMGATSNPEASLGILGTELFDQRRNDIKLLAFKTFGQKYAYFPDTTSAAFDKQNVRDGHYLPWSPTPYIAKLDGAGTATANILDPNARRIYELMLNPRGGDDVNGLLRVVNSGLIPRCAMKVTRAGDGADLALYEDPAPCGCYFEKNVPQGSTMCTTCTVGNDTPCGTGKCRLGYCEAK